MCKDSYYFRYFQISTKKIMKVQLSIVTKEPSLCNIDSHEQCSGDNLIHLNANLLNTFLTKCSFLNLTKKIIIFGNYIPVGSSSLF